MLCVCVREREVTVKGEHMVVILARADQELWLPGAPLTSIIHALEGLIATQPMFGYRRASGVLNLAPYFCPSPCVIRAVQTLVH